MASILTFSPRKSTKSKAAAPDGRPATVIIFPGVRYERLGANSEAVKWSPVDWRVWQKPNPLPAT